MPRDQFIVKVDGKRTGKGVHHVTSPVEALNVVARWLSQLGPGDKVVVERLPSE